MAPVSSSSPQVHIAYRSVILSGDGHSKESRHDQEEEPCLDRDAFRAFSVRLFAGAVVENVGKAVMKRVPIGVVGIAGVGAVTRSGKDLVGAAVGVYALGVAASVYLSLAG